MPSEHDEKLAANVLRFFRRQYDQEVMTLCVKRYVRDSKEIGVSLDDFVKRLTTITDAVAIERDSRRETQKLLQETKERMEGFNK